MAQLKLSRLRTKGKPLGLRRSTPRPRQSLLTFQRCRRFGRSHWLMRLIAVCAVASLLLTLGATMSTMDASLTLLRLPVCNVRSATAMHFEFPATQPGFH